VAGTNRTVYEASRANTKLAINVDTRLTGTNWQLHPAFYSATAADNAMAVFGAGKGAILMNTGPLTRITKKGDYTTGSLPFQLYSHSDQSKIWQTSLPSEPAAATGFLARMNEMLSPSFNSNQTYPSMYTFAGKADFSNGFDLKVAGVSSTGLPDRSGGPAGSTLKAGFDALVFPTNTTGLNPLQKAVVQGQKDSEAVTGQIRTTLASGAATIATTFTNANLKTALQLCKTMDQLGQRRQIHWILQGGFDQHFNLVTDLNTRLTATRSWIKQFYDAITDSTFTATGVKVTLLVYSEFGRTLTENGNGSDHAWGGHAMLFGPDVRGTSGTAVSGSCLYGLEHTLDFKNSTGSPPVNQYWVPNVYNITQEDYRGLMIPTTPLDCLYSTVAKWMGVPDQPFTNGSTTANPMDLILPNLVAGGFPNSTFTARDLGMLS
jgi:uncharacterized protein (DUF1501 family)